MKSHVDQENDAEIFSADDERLLIIGVHLLSELETNPAGPLSKMLLAALDQSLTDAHERALFNLSPKLDYDETLRPFKPPRVDLLEDDETR